MIYKRGKWYWMDDVMNGVRYREPLKTTNWQEAKRREKERLAEIADGKGGRSGPSASIGFNDAANACIEYRKLHSAEKTGKTDNERVRPLRGFFGDSPLRRITADSIEEFQTHRIAAGVSGRTANMEVGLLRRILKRYKQWVWLADDVKMLPERPKPARVLSSKEKERLLAVGASNPDWQVAHDATVLVLNTTMRGCELKGLQWNDVDLFGKTLKILRQSTKTDAGARVIPLNQPAYGVLLRRRSEAEALGRVELSHYVFPACENGNIQPLIPMKGWVTAWRSMRKKAGLPGFRFHDLRHHAITELAEMGLSDQTIMSIAGHVSREMLEHYSHIRLEAKRQALDGLNRLPEIVSEPVDQVVEARLN